MKTQSQYQRIVSAIITIGLLILTCLSCSKKEEEGRISPKLETAQVAEPNYKDILNEIELVQAEIIQQPADSQLHVKLVEISFDTSLNVIRAAGRGQPPMEAQSPEIAKQAAQEAAYIDACQWLAYILEWRDHPGTPEFGKIKAELPGARMVHKIIDANVTRVLVETKLP
jgi:hypothetical protein